MATQMPWVTRADGQRVQVPVGPDGLPDWAAVGPLAPPEPAAAGRTLPRDAFVGRLGLAHLAQIVAAAQSDPALGALIVRVQTAGELIDLDAPDVVAGLALLVARGILTAAEAAEVRA